MGAWVCPAHCSCPSYQICVCWAADTDSVPQHWAVEAELDDLGGNKMRSHTVDLNIKEMEGHNKNKHGQDEGNAME